MAGLLALIACGGDDGPSGGNPPPDDPPDDDPATVNVSVGDNFFSPGTVNTTAGATVVWTWAGTLTHNVTFSTGGGPNATDRSTGTFERTFSTAGTYNYNCTIHGTAMSGVINVAASGGTGGEGGGGSGGGGGGGGYGGGGYD